MGKLTDRFVKSAKAGRHGDGDGLYLVVSSTGRRAWVLRYQVSGERRDMGLGPFPSISLSEARRAAFEARKQIHLGKDPIEARRALKNASRGIPTFGDIAKIVIPEAQAESV
jgi:Arm DNA-binding domain